MPWITVADDEVVYVINTREICSIELGGYKNIEIHIYFRNSQKERLMLGWGDEDVARSKLGEIVKKLHAAEKNSRWLMVGKAGNSFCVPVGAITVVRCLDCNLIVGAGEIEYFLKCKTPEEASTEMIKICEKLAK
jgi:hypothetical protein